MNTSLDISNVIEKEIQTIKNTDNLRLDEIPETTLYKFLQKHIKHIQRPVSSLDIDKPDECVLLITDIHNNTHRYNIAHTFFKGAHSVSLSVTGKDYYEALVSFYNKYVLPENQHEYNTNF